MKWIFLLFANLIFTILAVVLIPVISLFVDKDGWLPKWLWWFQTPDTAIGKSEWFLANAAPYKAPSTWWETYANRMAWLFRNPAYGFDLGVLAYNTKDGDVLKVRGTRTMDGVVVENDPKIINGDVRHAGWFYATKGSAWQLYVVHHWNENHCTKLNLGWKLWGDDPHQFVFSPQGIYWPINKL